MGVALTGLIRVHLPRAREIVTLRCEINVPEPARERERLRLDKSSLRARIAGNRMKNDVTEAYTGSSIDDSPVIYPRSRAIIDLVFCTVADSARLEILAALFGTPIFHGPRSSSTLNYGQGDSIALEPRSVLQIREPSRQSRFRCE